MKRDAIICVFAAALAVAAVCPQAWSQAAGAAGSIQDSGPLKHGDDVFQFKVSGSGLGMAYKNGQPVASILHDRVLEIPGHDATGVEDAYKDWQASMAGNAKKADSTPPVQGNAGANAAPAPAPPPTFDAASNTAIFADGKTVTFIDTDNAQLTIPNAAGAASEYDLQYHAKSLGGAARSLSLSQGGNVGGSLSGSGVAIRSKLANGTETGVMFDTAEGTNLRGGLERVKPMVHAVLQAADAAREAGHSVESLHVVNSLRHNNSGMK